MSRPSVIFGTFCIALGLTILCWPWIESAVWWWIDFTGGFSR